MSRSVDKSSVDRSRRAREETEVDNRTAVLGLHKLKHCEVAQKKNVETEIVRMTDPSACADMFGAGSFGAVRKGAFLEILPVPPRGRFGKFSNHFLFFRVSQLHCESELHSLVPKAVETSFRLLKLNKDGREGDS